MASKKAKKLAWEILWDDGPGSDARRREIATALDHHGAAMARLAAEDAWRRAREWFGNEDGSRGSLYSINAAVQHAKEAQDE